MDGNQNKEIMIMDASKEIYLWKDVWWIKSSLFGATLLVLYLTYKISIYILERCLGYERDYPNYLDESMKIKAAKKLTELEKDTPVDIKKSHVHIVDPQSQMKMKDRRGYSQTKEDLIYPGDSDRNTFMENQNRYHGLMHHGIRYHDDNMSSSGARPRRPRMPSTVAESIMRQMKTPPIPAPAFPSNFKEASGSPTSCSNSNSSLKKYEMDMEVDAEEEPEVAVNVKPPPVPPRLSKMNKDVADATNVRTNVSAMAMAVEKRDSSVNTDWTGTLLARNTPSPDPVAVNSLTLHLHPSKGNDSESQLEIYMRRNNIHFRVAHDCHGPNGPWISDEGKKIEGLTDCFNYLQGKCNDRCYNKNLVCQLCKSKITCCCKCKECRSSRGHDIKGSGESQEMQMQTEDMYIDDNLEDMDRLSITSEDFFKKMNEIKK